MGVLKAIILAAVALVGGCAFLIGCLLLVVLAIAVTLMFIKIALAVFVLAVWGIASYIIWKRQWG